MNLKHFMGAFLLSLALLAAQSSVTRADEKVEVELKEREATGVTKGPRCTFTRAEKIGMLFWIIPIAGAIYTPFACKSDVFSKKVDVDVN